MIKARFDCPFCNTFKNKCYVFKHIKKFHKKEFKQLEKKIIDLFYDENFTIKSNFNDYEIPLYMNWHDVIEIWKNNFAKETYKARIENVRIKQAAISLIVKSQNVSEEEAKKINEERLKKLNKISNLQICKKCGKRITNNSWIKHTKQYHKEYFNNQLRKIIQLFDNLDVYNEEHFFKYNIDCAPKQIIKLWKTYIGENEFKIRTNILTGRQSAIKRFGKIDTEYIEWNTENDDKLSLNELIEKHSRIISIYLKKLKDRKRFKMSAGHLVPRIDLPEIRGCRSSWEANVYRILKYENKRFKNELEFKLPDVNHETKRGYKLYYVDFIDIDNCFGFGNDVYVEIKGVYGEDAKTKREIFQKTYPDKKLIMIGNDDPTKDFYPEIKYDDLCKKYQNVIPLWETKIDSVYTNPSKFLPKYLLDKDVKKIIESDNVKHFNKNLLSKKQKTSLSMSLNRTSNSNGMNGFRYDLNDFFYSCWEANIARIFQYENKNFDRNIAFSFLHNGVPTGMIVDFKDIENCFGFGNNVFIKIVNSNSNIIDKIASFRKEFDDKLIIISNSYNNAADINYDILQSKYQPLILLWECKDQNIRSTPEFYNQKLSEDLINKLKNKITIPVCPYCKIQYRNGMLYHLSHSKDELHKKIYQEQCQLIIEHFHKNELKNEKDLERLGIIINMSGVRAIWNQFFSKEEIRERTSRINSIQQKLIWRKRNESKI